jgi:outer membrane protein TolC
MNHSVWDLLQVWRPLFGLRKGSFVALFAAMSFGFFGITSFAKTLTLEEAIGLAFKTHEDPKISYESIERARIDKNRAFSFLLPTFAYEQSFTYIHPEINLGLPGIPETLPFLPDETWRRRITLTQPMYRGEFYPALRQGKEGMRLARENYAFLVKELLFSVARDYYEVLKAKALVEVAMDNLRLATQTLADAREHYRAGTVTKTDVLRAEVQKSEVEQALVSSRNNLLASKKLLGRMAGIQDYQNLEVLPEATLPPGPSKAKQPIEALYQAALVNRDDLKARLSALEVSKWSRRQVWGRFHPILAVDVSYLGIDPENPSELNDSYAVMFRVIIPILDAGTRFFDLQSTAREMIQARLDYERTKRDIEVEIVTAQLNIDTLRQNLRTLNREVELARENHDLTSKQYRAGVASSLDVQQTLTQLIAARNQLVVQTYDYEVSLLNLQRAIGLFESQFAKRYPNDVKTLTHTKALEGIEREDR